MIRTQIILLLLVLASFACRKNKTDDSCNGENTRRNIKIAIDHGASSIDTIPIITTVDSIGSISVAKADKETIRQDIEKKVFSITATVHKVSDHRDGDLKVKLTSGNDKFINCESPNPDCEYINDSRFFKQIQTTHKWIEDHYEELEGRTVTIVGVAFIDIDHKYPRKAAKNELELHPIIDIHY